MISKKKTFQIAIDNLIEKTKKTPIHKTAFNEFSPNLRKYIRVITNP